VKGLLRRLRGILGTGLTWAFGWIGLFGAYLLVRMAIGASLAGYEFFLPLLEEVFAVGTMGFLAGSTFGLALSILERHKRLEDLTFTRIALWGGLGGLAVVALLSGWVGGWGDPAGVIFYSILGVGSATGTLVLAKRAETVPLGGEDSLPAIEGE